MMMPAQEVAIWEAAYMVEPWGEVRDDMASGIVAATIANVNRGKDTPAFTPADFMLFHERQQPESAPHDLETIKRLTGGA